MFEKNEQLMLSDFECYLKLSKVITLFQHRLLGAHVGRVLRPGFYICNKLHTDARNR